ncbi:fimbrillin family protein [Parasphaerochaeta coccoides]|uniref:Regulator of chromosome condensation RCC1 n=1 Tax=Parasphaerochaeta coccoides (strain ATCC BAA-1237 / DSM 17374 / SPN1) TaxID=760011 RepID=F4GJ07_PARC1|nr:fimbrillin family protein [Parasphaerochaeta coccoides]AEC01302.1 regulator of chromosome condensation RCC1 [Parasphaerochaeta coccoides DSM 17374]
MRERERERERVKNLRDLRMNKSSRPGFVVLTTILILLVALISCDSKLNVSHTNEVRFTSAIGRKATANSEWQAADEVGIYMLEHGTGTAATAASERANRHYTADTAFQTSGFTPATAGDTLKWNDIADNADDTFDFIAYYPYVSPIADTTALPINVYPGSGEQDTGKADFLWGRTDNVQNNTSTVHLKLDHMLSRLIVNISPSTTVDKGAINNATGGFTVTVKGLGSETTINLNDGTLGTTDTSASILMKDISDTLTTTERAEGKRRFEAVLIPVGNTDALANVSLEFTLTGGTGAGTYTWAADSVATSDQGKIHFDKGKQHVYNMTLNTSDEEVAVAAIQIEIGDWDESDGGNWAATFKPYRAVSAGAYHTMFLKNNGTLWAAGLNIYSQLGVGAATSYKTSIPVWVTSMGSDVAAVSVGNYHTMILKKDGTLWATGRNNYGQLGDGTTTNRSTPVQVKASTTPNDFMTNVVAVSAGSNHTLILKKDGTLWATGRNNNGQLGDDTTANKSTPVPVSSMRSDVKAISAGDVHSMILKKNGTLWTTGANSSGQLGVSAGTSYKTSTPEQVLSMGYDVAAVSSRDRHTMILKKDGTLWATGYNLNGQLGDGTLGDYADKSTPVQVKDDTNGSGVMTDVAAVSAGSFHTLILKKDGTLWATGNNTYGQLGIGATPTQTGIPVQVMTDVKEIFAGERHTMILKKDGTLWATGQNENGQLGLGDSGSGNHRTTPEQVIF